MTPTLESLNHQRKAVIAVLALASIWQEEFPDGWVSVDRFADAGKRIGSRQGLESLQRAIRRGVEALGKLPEHVQVERRPSAGDRREEERRLVQPVPRALNEWVLSSGGQLISGEVWRRFQALEYRPVSSAEDALLLIESTIVRQLATSGHLDAAIARARAAIKAAPPDRNSTQLRLALAESLLARGGPEDGGEALHELQLLLHLEAARVEAGDALLLGRIHLSLARFLDRKAIREESDALLSRAKDHLALAQRFLPPTSYPEAAEIARLQGVHSFHAAVDSHGDDRQHLLEQAERYFLQALTYQRISGTTRELASILYALGDISAARCDNDNRDGLLAALSWYEAGIAYMDALGLPRQAACLARASVCHLRLVRSGLYLDRDELAWLHLQKGIDYLKSISPPPPAGSETAEVVEDALKYLGVVAKAIRPWAQAFMEEADTWAKGMADSMTESAKSEQATESGTDQERQ